jgi:acetyl-CoA synthetase
MGHYYIKSKEDYENSYRRSVEDPESFWSDIASEFIWRKPWDKVLEWEFDTPKVEWFKGGKMNITENCIDRHLSERGDDRALIWEANEPSEAFRTYTYRELSVEVNKMANIIKSLGVEKGDRVCLYLPMIPELMFAVLACARIGAIHSVVFAGFSEHAIADRINDSQCKLIITSDGFKRGDKEVLLKPIVDEALKKCESIEHVLVLERLKNGATLQAGRDVLYLSLYEGASSVCEAEAMDSEDPLFILYTSGSTGKPKGVVHTCGGYMVYTAYSFQNVFQYEKGDVYWCTADVGWITGHSYIIYGPLLNGACTMMFEGVPTYPDAGRFWDLVDKHFVNQFYTAPTAIRALMACDPEFVNRHSLKSLKTLGSVGEPINEEAWHWYHDQIGKGNCPVVDTWWQTETGGILLSALSGISDLKPAHAGLPLPGIRPVLLDNEGKVISENGVEGYLCIDFPWPSMIRTTYGDHERCKNTYFANYKGMYFTGDGAKRDENGLYRIIGRVDDVINVSGHRFGTAEIENAINEHKDVVESAVVGYPHDIKGQGIYAFVILEHAGVDEGIMRKELLETVTRFIGSIAKPDKIQIVSGLPKTRSGKIMRRILRKIAEGELNSFGDTSTLLDPGVVDEIVKGRI